MLVKLLSYNTCNKILYYGLLILALTSAGTLVYEMFWNIEHCTLVQMYITLMMTCYSSITAIVIEERPKATEQQRIYHRMIKNKGLALIYAITGMNIAMIIIAIFLRK